MLFHKSEPRRHHMGVKIAVCSLAAVGAYAIITASKKKIMCTCHAIGKFFNKMKNEEECSECCENS